MFHIPTLCTMAVCKVHGLTLLLRVATSWRCSDALFFEVPPLASDALLTTLHPFLENGVTVVLKEPVLGCRSKLSGVARLKIGNGCAHRDRWNPIRTSAIQSRSRPMRFLGFFNYEKGAPRSKLPVPLSSWSLRQTICSTFSRSGWSVVRSASLAKREVLRKIDRHRTSTKFRLGVIKWVHEIFWRPS
jgi:hypothetical protein